jgi:ABC-2 type transport system ATP-binding protein
MIHVENLTKYYDGLCAVNQISFDIQKGEILGLLGPNGAGKTTTLRMLTGFLRPSQGSIHVKDLDIEHQPVEIKKLMGYLPEAAPLYHEMLVFDYLSYVANIREIPTGEMLPRLKTLADLCGLSEVMHKPIGELSKGYKQRVGLAHAMMTDPEILILDEPTSGLDPNQIVEIREIIRKIGREKTIILSTHILSEAEATCDRVVIIHQGEIVADGSAADLKRSASQENQITILLQQADPDALESTLGQMEGIKQFKTASLPNDTIEVRITCRATTDLRASLYQKIKATDWILLEFVQQTQSLENIFRTLTQEN